MAESDPCETGLKALRLKVPRGYATRGLRTSERNPGVNRPLLLGCPLPACALHADRFVVGRELEVGFRVLRRLGRSFER